MSSELSYLPHEVAHAVRGFAARLAARLGDRLPSVTLYGSSARGSFQPGSDLNLLIVLKQADWQTLALVRNELASMKGCRLSLYLLTTRDLPHVLEAFPTRILEMQRGYAVLHGQDALAGLKVDKANLALRARQELLNIHLRFRHLLLGSADADALQRDLQGFVQPFFKTLRALVYVRTDEHIASRKQLVERAAGIFGLTKEPLLALSAWRSGKVAFAADEWDQAAAAFLVTLDQLTGALDG